MSRADTAQLPVPGLAALRGGAVVRAEMLPAFAPPAPDLSTVRVAVARALIGWPRRPSTYLGVEASSSRSE